MRVAAELIHMPNQGVVSLANLSVWLPTRMLFPPLALQCLLLHEDSTALALKVSKRIALLSVHFKLAAAHLFRRWTASLMLSPSMARVTSSTKK